MMAGRRDFARQRGEHRGRKFLDLVTTLTAGSASMNSIVVGDQHPACGRDGVSLTCSGCNPPMSPPSTGVIDQNRPRMSAPV